MIGQTLSHFKITAKLGEGGMGAVYLAQDTSLDREVAIKVLPEGFASDPERVARFEREAKLLAALDHPNIAGIYEVGHEENVHFLALQLVGGETLSERIKRGPVPLAEAVALALQVAEALEVAHGRGIIHRDLKPANVMADDNGQLKVLDFGLAKAFETPGGFAGNAAMTHSPTLTAQMTQAGVILGTAAYMSPEQAKGEEADKRSDIWSFGVMLAEMLTGQSVFQEPTVSETLASVLKSAPDLGQLPTNVPAAVRRLLDRCLRKDPRERLHDIADARLVLEDVAAGRVETELETPAGRSPLVAAGLVAAGLALGTLGMWFLGTAGEGPASELPVRRFVTEHGSLPESRPALSPEGHRLAYVKDSRIRVRDLRRLESLPISGTEEGRVPFWSPDGEWLGFSAQGSLWKIRLDGSGKTMVTSEVAGPTAGGAVWLPDGRIAVTSGSGEIFVVSERGGDPKVLSPLQEGEADYHFLGGLPAGKGLLTVVHAGDLFDAILHIGMDGQRREIARFPGEIVGQIVYSPTGHLIFERSSSRAGLWAAPFSLESLALTGEAFPLAQGAATPTISPEGTLAFAMSLPKIDTEIVMVNRSGQLVKKLSAPIPGIKPEPALSPDQSAVIVPVAGRNSWDLWSFDMSGGAPRRLTFDDTGAAHPVWTPDGSEVYYSTFRSTEDFKVRRMPAQGGGEPVDLLAANGPPAFTSDGKTMVYSPRAPGFNWDLWMRPVDSDGPGTPLLTGPEWELNPALSPDDRYLAYSEAGEVFIRSFPGMEGPWQVGQGEVPRWGPRGDRLFYLHGNDLMEVRLTTDPEPRFEAPQRLFSLESAPTEIGESPQFVVTADGENFIMVRSLEPPPAIVVVQNWLGAVE